MAAIDSPAVDLTPLAAGEWTVVPDRSALGFFTRAIMGLMPVRGRFSGFSGEVHTDLSGSVSGVLTVRSDTVSTGIKMRDKHLRTADFFAVERFPHMTFTLDSLTATFGKGAEISGTFQIRDRALPIRTPATIVQVGTEAARIDARFEVDHRRAGFEMKRLPRSVSVQASLTLARVD